MVQNRIITKGRCYVKWALIVAESFLSLFLAKTNTPTNKTRVLSGHWAREKSLRLKIPPDRELCAFQLRCNAAKWNAKQSNAQ